MMQNKASVWEGPETVGEFLDALSLFPREWRVLVSTPAGGGIGVEHREVKGAPVVAIFGKNGGSFGEAPLTDDEYSKKSSEFVSRLKTGYRYTSVHGDDRLYWPSGGSDTCYGIHYDPRIVERMIAERIILKRAVNAYGGFEVDLAAEAAA